MKHRIHILGASGSGASTLGQALSTKLPQVNLDGDDYYWHEKFTSPREPMDRFKLLSEDMDQYQQWILSGAVCGWGDRLKPRFDLVIFLHVPNEIRLERLRQREVMRYGDAVLPGGSMYEESRAFLAWASQYEDGGMDIRSKALHEQWMKDLTCPILKIEGSHSVQARVDIVLQYLNENTDGSVEDKLQLNAEERLDENRYADC
ncbi:AAA family ATPase [Paenibacillus sp. QZ-Y1]|uniref:AAA family ATPase n=1 Tax=Paenibacillus sp. QZ-Y1 TaxID=3414511 RepID=UPI003F799D28